MPHTLKLLLAQINPTVGAIKKNAEKITSIVKQHAAEYDVILFPELALSGYPPEDLLFQKTFHCQINHALEQIREVTTQCYVIVGHPMLEMQQKVASLSSASDLNDPISSTSWKNINTAKCFNAPTLSTEKCFNAASVFYEKSLFAHYYKQYLPNYGVFDECRYFTPGPSTFCILSVKGYRFGICICEDIWHPGIVEDLIKAPVDGFLCLNASPFDYTKQEKREVLLTSHAKKGLITVYTNQVGGQDDLVFDGQSMVYDAKGILCARAPAFQESLLTINIKGKQVEGRIAPLLDQNQLIYEASICALRNYVEKNGFSGVLLGLSGGIDSALTLAIAVDALGASRVHVLKMPSQYTSNISLEDAEQQLKALGVSSSLLSIEPAFKCLLDTLDFKTDTQHPSVVEENIQARIRGLLLMAYSNKTGKMVLITSNKSEIAIGYSTLYGDMAGSYAPLKDILKTQVYELARYRNTISSIIPERVLTRAPSAELAPNQTDQDHLPPYDILDGIIQAYMVGTKTVEEIIETGYPASAVHQVIRLIQRNEYKRFQTAPGPKISPKEFGRDWRYPITSGFEI